MDSLGFALSFCKIVIFMKTILRPLDIKIHISTEDEKQNRTKEQTYC